MLGKRLTIIVGDADLWQHRPLYSVLLERLKSAGCSGATVTRGIAGFGAHSFIKTAAIEVLSADLPVVITVIDAPGRIEKVLPEITEMLAGGIVTVEDADIRYYSAAFRGGFPDLAVASIMTKNPETVTPDTPIAEAMERMLKRDYTALPVVDADGRLLGVIDENLLLEKGVADMSLSLSKVVGPDLVREYLARLARERLPTRDAITTTPMVKPETSIKEAAHLMHAHGLKRLPVVDDRGRLVGVVGRLDILRSITSGGGRRMVPRDAALPQEHREVGEIMDRGVPTVRAETPLLDVLDSLLEAKAKRVVVVDDRARPVGIVTDTDLVSRVDPEDRPGLLTLLRSRWNEEARRKVRRTRGQRAADIMTSPVVTVRDNAPVMEALTLTVQKHFKRLPVVDAEGRLVGIVARPALLAASLDLASGGITP
jgi:CBS domain-containing protein